MRGSRRSATRTTRRTASRRGARSISTRCNSLPDEPAAGDADDVVDDAVADREHPVMEVHAAAGVVRDDLEVPADGGAPVEPGDVDVPVLLVQMRELGAGPPQDGAVAAVGVVVRGERLGAGVDHYLIRDGV